MERDEQRILSDIVEKEAEIDYHDEEIKKHQLDIGLLQNDIKKLEEELSYVKR